MKTYLMTCLSGLSLLLTPAAFAHDFWLSPTAFKTDPNVAIDVSVMIGHPSDRMQWPVSPHRVIALRSVGPDGVGDHQSAIADYDRNKKLPIRFKAPGLHMLTIETTHAFSELQSEKFNAYIEEEGLLPVQLDRNRRGTMDEPGTEIYSRRGKTLIEVGGEIDSIPDYITRPVGLTLEVVPLDYPNALRADDPLRAKILYRGEPVKAASVGLIRLDSDEGEIASQKTDAEGVVSFEKPEAGRWMLHVVWSDAMEDKSEADYDTIFSSLSFEIHSDT